MPISACLDRRRGLPASSPSRKGVERRLEAWDYLLAEQGRAVLPWPGPRSGRTRPGERVQACQLAFPRTGLMDRSDPRRGPRRVRQGDGAGGAGDGAGQHPTLQALRRQPGLPAVARGHRFPAGLRGRQAKGARAACRDIAGMRQCAVDARGFLAGRHPHDGLSRLHGVDARCTPIAQEGRHYACDNSVSASLTAANSFATLSHTASKCSANVP